MITVFLPEARAPCNLIPQLLLRSGPDGSLPLAETSTTLLLLIMKNVLAWWLSEDMWGGHKRAPCKRWATEVALIEECSSAADGITPRLEQSSNHPSLLIVCQMHQECKKTCETKDWGKYLFFSMQYNIHVYICCHITASVPFGACKALFFFCYVFVFYARQSGPFFFQRFHCLLFSPAAIRKSLTLFFDWNEGK